MSRIGINRSMSKMSMSIPEEFIEEAMNEMQRRPAVCVFCGTNMTIKVLNEHYDTCELYPIACPYRCGQKELPRNQMKLHLQECPLSVLLCDFSDLGCKFQGLENEIEAHKKEKMKYHLDLLCEANLRYKETAEVALGKLTIGLTEKQMCNTMAVKALEEKVADLTVQVKMLTEEFKETKAIQEEHQREELAELESTRGQVHEILSEGMKKIECARESISGILNVRMGKINTAISKCTLKI